MGARRFCELAQNLPLARNLLLCMRPQSDQEQTVPREVPQSCWPQQHTFGQRNERDEQQLEQSLHRERPVELLQPEPDAVPLPQRLLEWCSRRPRQREPPQQWHQRPDMDSAEYGSGLDKRYAEASKSERTTMQWPQTGGLREWLATDSRQEMPVRGADCADGQWAWFTWPELAAVCNTSMANAQNVTDYVETLVW